MKYGKHGLSKKTQSVLVSKSLYKTEQEARDFVKRAGYDDSYKLHPDQPKNNAYWRFRQYKPHEGAKYITETMSDGESKKVVEITPKKPNDLVETLQNLRPGKGLRNAREGVDVVKRS